MWVALASSDQSRERAAASVARNTTQRITDRLTSQLQRIWNDANSEAVQMLIVVLKNNLTKSVDEIMQRPDVQLAMSHPYTEAMLRSEELIRAAWTDAEEDAVAKVKGELALLKYRWQGYETDTDLLSSVLSDMAANVQAMPDRLRAALDDREKAAERLKKVADDATRRAQYSGSTAVWSVARQVRDSAFTRAGANKKWKARLDNKTCSWCKKLHNVVVKAGEEFPHPPITLYGGVLYGPPLHPNCRCIIVATKEPPSPASKLALSAA